MLSSAEADTGILEEIRTGAADNVAVNGIDLWLGGVHLHGQNNVWRWNQESATLVLPQSESF